jgi:hypothetical protein
VKVGEGEKIQCDGQRGERDKQAMMVFPRTQRLLEYGDGLKFLFIRSLIPRTLGDPYAGLQHWVTKYRESVTGY